MSYILITPIKNEENNLQQLKETVLAQSLKPVLWVIVDSGSSDKSYQLSQDIFNTYDWIHIIKQKTFFEQGYGHKNFSQAINEGYDYARQVSNNDIKYVGKTDATPLLSREYFEILFNEMEHNPELAITCGIQYMIDDDNKKVEVKPMQNLALTGYNDIRLYRRDFFEQVNGYPISYSPDSVLLIKAINRGWSVKVIDKTYFLKPRLGGSKIGMWNGYKLKGRAMYNLGYHPILCILNSLVNSIKIPPHYQFIPMVSGYLLCAIKREEREVVDHEVLDYFGEDRLKQVFRSLIKKLKY